MKDRDILAFETSCDETSVAVLKNDDELLSNVIASETKKYINDLDAWDETPVPVIDD